MMTTPDTFQQETCFKCGVQFAMTTYFYQQRRRDKGNFYCPNGHAQHFTGKSIEEKRIEGLEKTIEMRAASLTQCNKKLIAERKKVAKLERAKKRATKSKKG